jgi:hypothetical protein
VAPSAELETATGAAAATDPVAFKKSRRVTLIASPWLMFCDALSLQEVCHASALSENKTLRSRRSTGVTGR